MKRYFHTIIIFTFILMGLISSLFFLQCERTNPYDLNSDKYNAGSKPNVSFLDSTITGYLYEMVTIQIICSDTAKGGARGAIKMFYFDWDGSGAWSDSAAGTAEDTITVQKAFNARNVTARMRAIDYDGNFSSTDSITLTILPSNPQITDVAAPETVLKSVLFSITVSATDNGGLITSFLWAINGVDYTQVTLTGSITLSFDQTGDKTIKVKARDDKNIESPERSITIRVVNPLDTIGPTIAFLSPLDRDTLATPDILASLQIDDENAISSVMVNGASFQRVGNIWRGALTLVEGVNTLIATAVDANHNISRDSIAVYYAKSLVDTVPPLIVMIVPSRKLDTVYTPQFAFRLRALDQSGIAGVSLNDEAMVLDTLESGCYVAQKTLTQGMNFYVVKAVDGLGNTGNDSVSVYYDTQANDTIPPAISITSPQIYARFTDSSILVRGLVIDASGIFSLQVNGIEATLNYPNWLAVVPLRYGYDTIAVVAFDASARNNKAVQSVIVIKNFVPQFTTIPSDTSILVPTAYSVSASAIDPENGPLTFSLLPSLFTSATAPTLMQSGQTITIAYTPNASGIDTFKLVVKDALNDADTAIWRLFLHLPNDSSPVFTTDVKSLPKTITALATLQSAVTAIDPNNQPLTYSFIRPTTPIGMTISATAGSITWATAIADTGAKHIIVQASNGRQSDTLEWDLAVLFRDEAPVLANPGVQTIHEGQTLSLTFIATDPDNDPLVFVSGPQFPASATLDSNRFSWTPGYSDSGRQAVTIIARERTRVPALSDTATFMITVTNVNPQTPELVLPLNGATAQPISFALVWKKATAAQSYHLQLSTDIAFNAITFQDSAILDTLKTVIGLANNTTYYWRIKAKNPGGESAWSTHRSFTTIVATPGIPSLIYPAHNVSGVELTPTLQWSAVTGASSYSVQVDDQSTFASPVLSVAVTGTSQAATVSNGTKYYWRVNATTSGIAGAWATDSFTTIFSAPVITVHPSSQTVNEGAFVSFNVTASGSQLSYQWQSRTSGSASWSNINGSTFSTHGIIAAALSNSGSQFRCVVSNSGGAVTSNTATLTVTMTPPAISAQPSNQSVTEGASASFSVTASGSQLTYQWQRSNNSGTTWTNISSAASSTYTISSTTLYDGNARFHCVITNAAGSVTSNAVTLTVAMAPPVIAVQPWDQGVTVGATASFSLTANGSGTLTYQWLRNGTVIEGATSASYTTPATTISDNNTQFRCVVTNAGGSVTSNTVTLWVSAAPTYSVIYIANGGTGQVTDPNRYTAGATVTVLGQGNLARTGYTFTGWNTIAAGNGTSYVANNTFLMPAGNDTLFAQWTTNSISAPTLVSPANNQTGVSISPTLTWSSVANATTYHVQWSTISNDFATGAMNDSTLTTNYKGLSGLLNATPYYWRVRAKNIANIWSSWSAAWSFTTIAATPGVPALIFPSHNAVNVANNPTLRWTRVAGAGTYTVQLDDQANFSSPVLNADIGDTSQAASLTNGMKYHWRVRATISGVVSAWATDSFTTNSAPVVTDIPNQTIAEGAAFTTINLDNYVSDADNIDAQITWTYSGNTSLAVSIVSRVATITIPGTNWNGAEAITFRATDPSGLYSEDAAAFTVTAVNDAPVVSDIPNQTIAEGATFTTINLDDYVSDVDNIDADLTWTYSGNTALTVSIVSRIATITIPGSDWNGAEAITFRATDPSGLYSEDAAAFTVTAVNDAPVVSDIPNQTIAEGATFTTINLDDYVSDVDNIDADLTWTYSGNTALTVSISAGRVATITIPSSDWNGAETVTFRATDPGALFSENAATFSVTAVNDAPVNTVPSAQSTGINASLEITGLSITDVDAGTGAVEVTLAVANGTLTVSGGSASITGSGSGSVTLEGTIAAINATLGATVTYGPATGYSGSDTLTMTTSDQGNTGSGGIKTDIDEVGITIE
jgi:uncharacterized repeat protein (TIGR02543 family)